MRTKIALLVLYNHRFEKNIEKVKQLYSGKFSHVFQLIPFYEGTDPSVIPVYGSSYFFQSFISQAYSKLKDDGYTHFFIVADDMVINPQLTEENLFSVLGIDDRDAFISNLSPLQTMEKRLAWMKNALNYTVRHNGLEIENILPTKEEAIKQFCKHNLPTGKIPLKYFANIERRGSFFKSFLCYLRDLKEDFPLIFKRHLNYPIVKAYSDILLVPSLYMNKFSTYCGAFASSGLFVELAIPTSLILTVESGHLKTCDDTILKYGAIWTNKELNDLSNMYNNDLNSLLNNYPSDKLFLHPVKLSKWSC